MTRHSPLLDFLPGDSGMCNGDVFLLEKLRPEGDRSVQHRLPRVVDLCAVLVLRFKAATAVVPAAIPAPVPVPPPRGRPLDGVVRREREERVDVLHEDIDALDLIFVEGRGLPAEVVAEADHLAAAAGPVRVRVGREEPAAVAGDALPPLGPAALLERVLALDILVAAAGAWLLTVAPGVCFELEERAGRGWGRGKRKVNAGISLRNLGERDVANVGRTRTEKGGSHGGRWRAPLLLP